jgi:hypothetical protein
MTTQNLQEALLLVQIATLVVNIIVVGVLAWTGWSAHRSAKAAQRSAEAASAAAQATKQATLAELITGLMKEYGSPEMHNYGVKLVNFAKKAQDEGNFPCRIPHGVEALEMPCEPEIAELDHASRYFQQFHIRVYALHKLGLIDDDAAKMIISKYNVEFLLKQYLSSYVIGGQRVLRIPICEDDTTLGDTLSYRVPR